MTGAQWRKSVYFVNLSAKSVLLIKKNKILIIQMIVVIEINITKIILSLEITWNNFNRMTLNVNIGPHS